MIRTVVVMLFVSCGSGIAHASILAFTDDFDGGQTFGAGISGGFSGIITTESVQGYAGIGHAGNQFGGNFLRNKTGGSPKGTSGEATVLTLFDLPTHTSIDLNFLFGAIDSWDIQVPWDDRFSVRIDGVTLFSQNFTNNPNASLQGYQPPANVLLLSRPFPQLGFNEGFEGQLGFDDSAYDLGLDTIFDDILHTQTTLTIEFISSGPDWQGGGDESFAIENVAVVLNGTVPEPGSACIWSLIALCGLIASRKMLPFRR